MTGAAGDEWPSKGVPNSILLAKPFAPAQLLTALPSSSIQGDLTDCTYAAARLKCSANEFLTNEQNDTAAELSPFHGPPSPLRASGIYR
jgi:hypothetical protein